MVRVLVVDDDAVTRALVARLLATADDIEVVGFAASGEEASALAEALHPDVVLLDLFLGAQDGRELIGVLRLAAPGAILVVLTALPDEDARRTSLEAGADAFWNKSRELYVRLPDALREQRAALRAGDD